MTKTVSQNCRFLRFLFPYKVKKEVVGGADIILTSFLFYRGANIYCLSYKKDGSTKHTLIDAGDIWYRHAILSLLKTNDINPRDIERIILTHHHPDHCGSASRLVQHTSAKILVHPNFKIGFGSFGLKKYVQYLPYSEEVQSRIIGGINFPILATFDIGGNGSLEVLGNPKVGSSRHTNDQVVVFFRPFEVSDSKPYDQLLFSGDFWLMNGPFTRGMGPYWLEKLPLFKQIMGYQLKFFHRQDFLTRKASKIGFVLIRVFPGHGSEFMGSRIVSNILSRGDILMELGFYGYSDRSILENEDLSPKIKAMCEDAYNGFIEELMLWRSLGYSLDEIAELLLRIYKEQCGGRYWVREDRKERRKSLEQMLERLKADETQPEECCKLAKSALDTIRNKGRYGQALTIPGLD